MPEASSNESKSVFRITGSSCGVEKWQHNTNGLFAQKVTVTSNRSRLVIRIGLLISMMAFTFDLASAVENVTFNKETQAYSSC